MINKFLLSSRPPQHEHHLAGATKMNYFLIFLAFFAITSLVSGAFYSEFLSRVQAQKDRMRTIIRAEDNPQKLLEVFEELRRLGEWETFPDIHLLNDTIQSNRVESFKLIYNLSRSHGSYGHNFTPYLKAAIDQRRFEIADFLLSQPDVPVPDVFEGFARWNGRRHIADFLPDIEQFKELATRHQDKVILMAPSPDWPIYMRDPEMILLILDFIRHCRSISPDFAALPGYEPTYLLDRIIYDPLPDPALVRFITYLAGMGANFTVEGFEQLQKALRDEFPLSLQAYFDALYTDIKEPEVRT
jgi:hypothetical protein